MKVFIDISQIVYANWHVWNREHHTPTFTDALQININSITYDLMRKLGYETHYFMLVDSRPSFRTQIFPEYKGHRPSSEIPWTEIEQFLFDTYACFKFDQLEADDLAFLIADARKEEQDVVLVSSDSDWPQIVERCGCKLYNPTIKDFVGVPEISWKTKVVIGDTSDNIPRCIPTKIGSVDKKGVVTEKAQRVGEGTVQKLLDKGQTISEIINHFHGDHLSEDAQRNYKLIVFDYRVYDQYVPNINKLKEALTDGNIFRFTCS